MRLAARRRSQGSIRGGRSTGTGPVPAQRRAEKTVEEVQRQADREPYPEPLPGMGGSPFMVYSMPPRRRSRRTRCPERGRDEAVRLLMRSTSTPMQTIAKARQCADVGEIVDLVFIEHQRADRHDQAGDDRGDVRGAILRMNLRRQRGSRPSRAMAMKIRGCRTGRRAARRSMKRPPRTPRSSGSGQTATSSARESGSAAWSCA